MKYVDLIKGVILVVVHFFVLDYLKEGEITYRTFILAIAGILIIRGAGSIVGWTEKQYMTYNWLEAQRTTQNRRSEEK